MNLESLEHLKLGFNNCHKVTMAGFSTLLTNMLHHEKTAGSTSSLKTI